MICAYPYYCLLVILLSFIHFEYMFFFTLSPLLPFVLLYMMFFPPPLSLELRTSLKIVSGPSQKRKNLKTMNSLPNLPWPSPHRQSVSVWSIFYLFIFLNCFYHVTIPSNEQFSIFVTPTPHILSHFLS